MQYSTIWQHLTAQFQWSEKRVYGTADKRGASVQRLAGLQARTGRKWKASNALQVSGSRLRQKDMVGNTATGRGRSQLLPLDPNL